MNGSSNAARWLGIVGLSMLVFGLACLVWPRETVIDHPTTDHIGWARPASPVKVSRPAYRIYGAATAACGILLLWMALSRPRE